MADRISALSEYEKRRRSNIMEREELFRVVLEAKGKVNNAFKKKKKISSGKPKPKEVLTPRKSKRILEGKVRPSPRFIPQAESIQDYKLRTLEPEETHFKYSTMEKDLEELKTTFTEFADNITVPKKKWIYYDQDLFIEKFSGYQSLMGKDAETETIMGRITCSAIHPTKHMILGCAANFEGKIFLGRFTESEAQYTYFRPHHEKIFHQTWDIYKPEQMITSSYDGTVRIFDIRSLQARLMYGDRNFIESDGGCFTHAQVDRDTFLISKGNKNGGWISVMDTRKSIFPVQEYFVSEATAYMTSIDVCPTKKFQFLAADGEGIIKLFDTRFTQTSGGRTTSRRTTRANHVAIFQNSHPESFAHWSPVSGNQVIVSNSSQMKVYDAKNIYYNWVPVQQEINFSNGNETSTRGYWHPKYDDIYLKFAREEGTLKGGLHCWKVDTSNTENMFKRVGTISCHQRGYLDRKMRSLAIHPTHDIMLGFFNSKESTAALLGIDGDLFSSHHFDNTEDNRDEMTDADQEEANEMVEYKGDSVQADDGKEDTKNNTIEHRNDAIESESLSIYEVYEEEFSGMSDSSPTKSDSKDSNWTPSQ